MSSAVSMIGPKFYAWDSDTGKPLAFGKVYTYAAGTNTPKPTWQSEDGVTENTNPVILNAAGYADIYLRGRYKIVVKDADDVEVWTSDPVSDASQLLESWIHEISATQVAPDEFKVTGNLTDVFYNGRSVKLDDAAIFYGTVSSSSYLSGETFVTISADTSLTSDLSRAWVSVVDLKALQPAFVELGGSLGDGKGGLLVNGAVIYVDLIDDLQALPTSDFDIGQAADVQGVPLRWSGSAWEPSAGYITPEIYGAKGDGASDDSAAFISALNSFPGLDAFDILLGSNTYKINSTALYLTRSIRIKGAGRSNTVLDFSSCADVVNAPYNSHVIFVHPNNIEGSSSFADPIQVPSGWVGDYGFKAIIEDLQISCNPAIANGIGIFINAPSFVFRVRCIDANLHNFAVIANATNTQNIEETAGSSGLSIGGNANLTNLDECEGRGAVNGEGLIVKGSDSNACIFTKFDSRNNEGYGIADSSLLGCTHIMPHTSGNKMGGYWSTSTDPSYSTFISPYAEGAQGVNNGGKNTSFGNRALILNPQGDIELDESGAIRKLAGTFSFDSIVRVGTGVNADAPRTDIEKGSLSIDRSDVGMPIFEIKRLTSTYFSIQYNSNNSILFHASGGTGAIKDGVPWLSLGMALSPSHRQTAGSAIPTSGTYVQGEVVWNENPTAGGFVGWVCVAGGTPGTWKGFGAIEA